MKKILLLCTILVLGFSTLFVGCGSEKAAQKEKVLKVATCADFAPFEFQGDKGKFEGFDMDIIRAIGKKMGDKVEISNIGFDGLIPALETGNVDAIISGLSINGEREKKVAFSAPYYKSGLTIVVKKSNTGIKSFADLKGKKIAVQIGTTGATEAKKIPGAQVKEFNSSADTFIELKAGNVDAVINDKPVNAYYMVESGDKDVKVVGEPLTSEEYAIAVKKGNTKLLDKINKALEEIKADGTYAKIYKKWFGTEPTAADK